MVGGIKDSEMGKVGNWRGEQVNKFDYKGKYKRQQIKVSLKIKKIKKVIVNILGGGFAYIIAK